MSKRYLGYILCAIYILLHFDLYWFDKVDPIILGLPYALWGKVLYGFLAVPFLYLIYHWIWPDLPETFEE